MFVVDLVPRIVNTRKLVHNGCYVLPRAHRAAEAGERVCNHIDGIVLNVTKFRKNSNSSFFALRFG